MVEPIGGTIRLDRVTMHDRRQHGGGGSTSSARVMEDEEEEEMVMAAGEQHEKMRSAWERQSDIRKHMVPSLFRGGHGDFDSRVSMQNHGPM